MVLPSGPSCPTLGIPGLTRVKKKPLIQYTRGAPLSITLPPPLPPLHTCVKKKPLIQYTRGAPLSIQPWKNAMRSSTSLT